MNFLPKENVTYKTHLTENEVIKRLSDAIEPRKTFRFKNIFSKNTNKPYEGEINQNQFKINRIISYRNSFLPIIEGVIEQKASGTQIKVNMKLHTVVLIFMGIFCVLPAFFFISIFAGGIQSFEFKPEYLIPFGMLIFLYAMSMGGFKFESSKSKKELKEIFSAEIVEQ